MHTVCFFNNKGGVGKTTLLSNVASFIASSTVQKRPSTSGFFMA